MSVAPDDGPLCPVVLWRTSRHWKLTNNGGRDWWDLADPDLPEWLLVPRVKEALSLPRSDVPSWFQPPSRSTESRSDADTGRALRPLCADSLRVAHDALHLIDLVPEADAGPAEWRHIDTELARIEQCENKDECWMGWLPSLATRARMATEPLTHGELVGFGIDPRLRLRSACMVHAGRIADMAAAFGAFTAAGQLASAEFGKTSCCESSDDVAAASSLLTEFAWRHAGDKTDHVRSLTYDMRRILDTTRPARNGVKVPYRKTAKLRRLALSLLKPARDEMFRLSDQTLEEDRPIVALGTNEH